MIKLQSLKQFDFSSLTFNDFMKSQNTNLTDINRVSEPKVLQQPEVTIAVVLHIHYLEEIDKVINFVCDLGKKGHYFFSTSSQIIFEELSRRKEECLQHLSVSICQVPNVGRNFAPLFVSFSREILGYEYLLHWHSKRSTHANRRVRQAWISALDATFLSKHVLFRGIAAMRDREDCALMYPDVVGEFRKINFRWNLVNRKRAETILSRLSLANDLGQRTYVLFPIGGMFLAKTSLLKPIFEASWNFSDFDEEAGQLDGTLHHAFERFLGTWCELRSLSQLVYRVESDEFFNISHLEFRGK